MKLTPAVMRRLDRWSAKVLWWKCPEEARAKPMDLIARLMALGTWEDVRELKDLVGPRVMKQALRKAAPGIFLPPAWHYWHRRLGLPVEPLPKRKL